jgi:hypothetical protein
MTAAFEYAARLARLVRKSGVDGGGEIETSVAVRIGTWKLEKSPSGGMQDVRLGNGRVCRGTLERQLETQLLNRGEFDPECVCRRALAPQAIRALLACVIWTR